MKLREHLLKLFPCVSIQNVQHLILKMGISLAGLEQEQHSTTSPRLAIIQRLEMVEHQTIKVTGGLEPSRTGPHNHIQLESLKGTGPRGP